MRKWAEQLKKRSSKAGEDNDEQAGSGRLGPLGGALNALSRPAKVPKASVEALFEITWPASLQLQSKGPSDSFDAGVPSVFKGMDSITNALKASQCRSVMASFLADFVASPAFKGNVGKGMKNIEAGEVAEALTKVMLDTSQEAVGDCVLCTPPDFASRAASLGLSDREAQKLAGIMSSTSITQWAMGPNRSFFGYEFAGYGVVVVQTQGFRTIVGMKTSFATRALLDASISTSQALKDKGIEELPEVFARLSREQAEKIAEQVRRRTQIFRQKNRDSRASFGILWSGLSNDLRCV